MQIATLHMMGHHIILVSSGSIPIGKMVLHRQYLLSGSMQVRLAVRSPPRLSYTHHLLVCCMQSHLGGRVGEVEFFEKACAAAGQSGLQSLYEMLFAQYHLACSQILASDADFRRPQVRENLKKTVRTLLDVGIIPVINENDIITQRQTPLLQGDRIGWDNDSLASLFAQELGVDLMIILTDVDGVFKLAADGKTHTLVHEFQPSDVAVTVPDSRCGPIGQKDKLHSSIRVVDSGAVRAAVIAKGEPGVLLRILKRERVGTYFAVRHGRRIGGPAADQYIDPLYSDILKPTTSKL